MEALRYFARATQNMGMIFLKEGNIKCTFFFPIKNSTSFSFPCPNVGQGRNEDPGLLEKKTNDSELKRTMFSGS